MNIGVKAPKGGMFWHPEAIRRILANEKYYGDVILQKSFSEVYFTGKRQENKGEYKRYVFKKHHKAIITPATK